MSNELEELKQRSSETTVSSKPPRFNILRRDSISGSSSNQSTKFVQILNVVLNVEIMGMDQYCSFHQEHHSEKTCPEWNHIMDTLAVPIIDVVISYE